MRRESSDFPYVRSESIALHAALWSVAMADSAEGGNTDRVPPSTPRERTGHKDRATPEAVPSTIYKQKVRWSLDFLDSSNDLHRASVFEELDASLVKGDVTDGLSGVLDETEKAHASRVEEEAFQVGHQDDILFNNDVVRREVEKASDAFVMDSIQVAETLEEEDVVLEESRPRGGKRKAATMDLEVHCVSNARW